MNCILKDLEKRELVHEQISKAYYDKFNFKPEINEISKKIGRYSKAGYPIY